MRPFLAALVLLALALYESYALLTGEAPTISAYLWAAGRRCPLVPACVGCLLGLAAARRRWPVVSAAAAGMLLGHWFWT